MKKVVMTHLLVNAKDLLRYHSRLMMVIFYSCFEFQVKTCLWIFKIIFFLIFLATKKLKLSSTDDLQDEILSDDSSDVENSLSKTLNCQTAPEPEAIPGTFSPASETLNCQFDSTPQPTSGTSNSTSKTFNHHSESGYRTPLGTVRRTSETCYESMTTPRTTHVSTLQRSNRDEVRTKSFKAAAKKFKTAVQVARDSKSVSYLFS